MEFTAWQNYSAGELASDWSWVGHFTAIRPGAVARIDRREWEEAHYIPTGSVKLVQIVPAPTEDRPMALRVHICYISPKERFVLKPIEGDRNG